MIEQIDLSYLMLVSIYGISVVLMACIICIYIVKKSLQEGYFIIPWILYLVIFGALVGDMYLDDIKSSISQYNTLKLEIGENEKILNRYFTKGVA